MVFLARSTLERTCTLYPMEKFIPVNANLKEDKFLLHLKNYIIFKILYTCVYLMNSFPLKARDIEKERYREREILRLSIYWFIFQIPVSARIVPNYSQESRTPTRSSR